MLHQPLGEWKYYLFCVIICRIPVGENPANYLRPALLTALLVALLAAFLTFHILTFAQSYGLGVYLSILTLRHSPSRLKGHHSDPAIIAQKVLRFYWAMSRSRHILGEYLMLSRLFLGQ